MSAESVAKSMGHHAHWGFSSGFDFIEALVSAREGNQSSSEEPINILLIQPGDIRHILYTVSRRRRHVKKFGGSLPKINFYLFETPVETIARDLLLLQILTDYEVPIRQRANIYLEVFGNNKVQRRTSEYMDNLGKQLKLLSAKGTGTLDHLIDFSLLNYRERDLFESALQAYSPSFVFDMDSLYDHRQRGLYEDRFDSRKALSDWDYHASIKNKASIVHIKQYRQWRHNGIAFEFGDQTYDVPNRSLMTYTEGFMKKGKEKGLKKEVKGFWGDIVCSPYFAIGIDSDTPNKHAEGLYEIQNKNTGTEQHRHHAVEIALYNMYSILWEIETGSVYRMTKPNDIYSGLGQFDKSLEVTRKDEEKEVEESVAQKKDLLDTIIEETEEAGVESEESRVEELPEPPSTQSKDDIADEPEEQTTPPSPPTEAVSAFSATSLAVSSTQSLLAPLEVRKKQEASLVRAIQRAETIVESFDGIKIYPMTGTLTTLLAKSKVRGTVDGIFVSSRAAQVLGEDNFTQLFRATEDGTAKPGKVLVAVETAKHLVPLKKDVQVALCAKEEELAGKIGLKRISAPVPRRRRDELDLEDDVIFFTSSS
eukprot:CAMPEP_0184974752 /NCGR_PEP_ID=MMETSP1098-20130426/6140_1 /TAXON_ID=89044 /ORGANISM="Spumella elongata, Strain CCAP 955/1" /LENGTH=593 /DNA_ID=CAMNT_0027497375 /DNA_START=40 /DNA_END=1821 /DNA_ORIENTATION=-